MVRSLFDYCAECGLMYAHDDEECPNCRSLKREAKVKVGEVWSCQCGTQFVLRNSENGTIRACPNCRKFPEVKEGEEDGTPAEIGMMVPDLQEKMDAAGEIAYPYQNVNEHLRVLQGLIDSAAHAGDLGLLRIAQTGVAWTSLVMRKYHDYGDSVWRPSVLAPEVNTSAAIRVRMSDKISRLSELFSGRQSQLKEETIDDTIADLGAYCLLYLARPSQPLSQKEDYATQS